VQMYDLVFLRIDRRGINHVLLTWPMYQRTVRYVTKYRDKKSQVALSIHHVFNHVVRRFWDSATPVGSLANQRKERSSKTLFSS